MEMSERNIYSYKDELTERTYTISSSCDGIWFRAYGPGNGFSTKVLEELHLSPRAVEYVDGMRNMFNEVMKGEGSSESDLFGHVTRLGKYKKYAPEVENILMRIEQEMKLTQNAKQMRREHKFLCQQRQKFQIHLTKCYKCNTTAWLIPLRIVHFGLSNKRKCTKKEKEDEDDKKWTKFRAKYQDTKLLKSDSESDSNSSETETTTNTSDTDSSDETESSDTASSESSSEKSGSEESSSEESDSEESGSEESSSEESSSEESNSDESSTEESSSGESSSEGSSSEESSSEGSSSEESDSDGSGSEESSSDEESSSAQSSAADSSDDSGSDDTDSEDTEESDETMSVNTETTDTDLSDIISIKKTKSECEGKHDDDKDENKYEKHEIVKKTFSNYEKDIEVESAQDIEIELTKLTGCDYTEDIEDAECDYGNEDGNESLQLYNINGSGKKEISGKYRPKKWNVFAQMCFFFKKLKT